MLLSLKLEKQKQTKISLTSDSEKTMKDGGEYSYVAKLANIFPRELVTIQKIIKVICKF